MMMADSWWSVSECFQCFIIYLWIKFRGERKSIEAKIHCHPSSLGETNSPTHCPAPEMRPSLIWVWNGWKVWLHTPRLARGCSKNICLEKTRPLPSGGTKSFPCWVTPGLRCRDTTEWRSNARDNGPTCPEGGWHRQRYISWINSLTHLLSLEVEKAAKSFPSLQMTRSPLANDDSFFQRHIYSCS